MAKDSLTKFQLQAARLGLENINATNILVFLANVVAELKSLPSAGSLKANKHHYVRVPVGSRQETTLYEYYNSMIKDTLKQINKTGGRAYVFSIEQIADVIKYDKDAEFTYIPEGECFMVTKRRIDR
jgi:hypothetical protein